MGLSECRTITDGQGRELADHGTPLFPFAGYHDDLALTPVPWHWHDELEALLVEEGEAVLSADGESCTLRQGEGCFLNAGLLHSVRRAEEGPCRLHSLVFLPKLVGGGMDSVFWQGYVGPLTSESGPRCVRFGQDVPWHREAVQAIEDAWQACAADRPGYEFGVREALSRLVLLLTEHCPARRRAPSDKALRDSQRIKAMLRYIQDNCGEELTVEAIAGSAAVSESECLRCFRAMVGTTPIQYVRQLRVQRAAELLASSDRKIADIAAQCGFQDMSYFSRTFRALKDCTPGEYRAGRRS